MESERRVLLLTPTARDAANTRAILADAGIPSEICRDLPRLCREIEAGAAAALLAEEELAGGGEALADVLGRQPPWSDLPILLLARGGARSPVALRAVASLGNVTLLERPLRIQVLVTAVRAAIRARNRQYEVRQRTEELAEAGRRKDEFLATLAHELRNPLAPIRTGVQLLRLTRDGDRDDAETLATMDRQLAHMVRLIDDLMDVARVSRGKITLRMERVDLRSVFEGALETSRQLIEAGGHELVVRLPAEPIAVEADRTRLCQVVANLLNNAAKYSEPGGRIVLEAERAGPEALIRVRDRGVGIPSEMLPKVFDMFTQVGTSLAKSQGGLGIGLTLVRTLVGLHGGSVAAASEGPGRGSEFLVRLPAPWPAGAAAAGGPADEPAPPRSAPRSVLVVDDNVDAARLLAQFLELEGHDVRVAHEGIAAIEAFAARPPDVVLLDIGLPGLDGYEVARRLRARAGGGPLLVALTGYGQQQDRALALAAGFDHHLVKPVSPPTLLELLASLGGDPPASPR